MTEVFITFAFHRLDRRPISNDVVFNLRRELVQMLERCGFGDVIESGSDKFENVTIHPLSDLYFSPEEELVICYSFNLPLQQGDINILLSEGILNLHEHIRDHYEMIIPTTRITIS